MTTRGAEAGSRRESGAGRPLFVHGEIHHHAFRGMGVVGGRIGKEAHHRVAAGRERGGKRPASARLETRHAAHELARQGRPLRGSERRQHIVRRCAGIELHETHLMRLMAAIHDVKRVRPAVHLLHDDEFVVEHRHVDVADEFGIGWRGVRHAHRFLHAERGVGPLILRRDGADDHIGARFEVDRRFSRLARPDAVRSSHMFGPRGHLRLFAETGRQIRRRFVVGQLQELQLMRLLSSIVEAEGRKPRLQLIGALEPVVQGRKDGNGWSSQVGRAGISSGDSRHGGDKHESEEERASHHDVLPRSRRRGRHVRSRQTHRNGRTR
ncbi:hypothetical protein NITMOv2_3922 [Nitrospira moscoviensis]|uniref:Uncharacterized protein n=1 Tax=Nitrospira moscoviensis TaxID=42253 RepID=A0A0K2GI63_NITMO|nr:hypothetical protein NITMOv2_3922 [Nitrospira moscoviensis]